MKTGHASGLRTCNKFILLVAPLILWLPLGATLPPACGQALRIETFSLAPELRNSQILRISDFNITGSGSASQLFDLVVANNGAAANVMLSVQIVSDRFPATPIVEAITQLSVLSGERRSLTYDDFRRGLVNYNSQAVDELTNAILQTGRLPDGTYTFNVTIFDNQQPNVPQDSDVETLDISNPTTLDLISPGVPVNRGECPALFGQLPQFKWDSNANRFLITVCEALPANSSPEDVMQNQPRLQRILQRDVDFLGSPSFIYPSGDLPLEYGKTYYWQIHAIVDSPSGEARLPGEIWCFRISSHTNPGGGLMLQQLLNLLGSNEIEALFEEGGPLHGYTLTGEVVLDGQHMSLAELLAQLRSRPLRISSMQVE
jgi:hypothetical protein